jgi:hypothetical protein
MSTGLGIFLSSFVVAIVILYGITMDRWNWRRIVKRATLGIFTFVVIAAAASGGLWLWNQLPPIPFGGLWLWNQPPPGLTRQTEYANVRLGMTPAEVLSVKSDPDELLEEDDDWRSLRRLIGIEELKKKGKSVKDYRYWEYLLNKGTLSVNTISVTFNEAKTAVVAISCSCSGGLIPNDHRLSSCPSIAGVMCGDSESDVVRKLGNPDTFQIGDDNGKLLAYRDLGISLTLYNPTPELVHLSGIDEQSYLGRFISLILTPRSIPEVHQVGIHERNYEWR